jgi:hypothetical protein
MDDNKEYNNLTTVEKMYEYYLRVKKENLKNENHADFLVVKLEEKGKPIRIPDEEIVEVSKKILSLEEFKTALIYRLVYSVEEATNILSTDPDACNFVVEEIIDNAVEGVMWSG